jgi:putative hydrolase of the HAD superfamily
MKSSPHITTLFVDIGGVLLTDGWDHNARRRAARTFGLERAELEERHHLSSEIYEEGRLTLDEYLALVVFHKRRGFTQAQFRRFMYAQSRSHPEMLALVSWLKRSHGLKVAAVSNEGRELNAHRIRAFELDGIVDAFISSSFFHVRKPDPQLFRIALDVVQRPVREVAYLENTPLFVEIAESLGIRSILHRGVQPTRAAFGALGLRIGPGSR